ncbi:MAG: type IV pili methyl-accepting chemotaxis transducer N-terminal domain-containing protein [Pseudomonadota bacterium]
MTINFSDRALRGVLAGLVPAVFLAVGQPALAEQAASKSKADLAAEIGASERVNYSGKLRMLSQRVVATGCNAVAGIDPEASGAAMRDAMNEFALIVDALEFGNSDLGINGAEKRRKTQARIQMLRDEWAPVAKTLEAIDGGDKSEAQLAVLAERSAPLLEMAKILVSDLSAQYSDPNAMLQMHAILVDISGRQRMLTQRMSKNVCLAASGVDQEKAKVELAATAKLFEASLLALSSGMLSAGINPPPTPEIDAGLKVVISDWQDLKPAVEGVLNGDDISAEERARVFHGMNTMTGNMNSVVGLYSEASKLGS